MTHAGEWSPAWHGMNPISDRNLERAKGFEPSTPTLARLCSTPELRPLDRRSGKMPRSVERAPSIALVTAQPQSA